MPRMPTFEEIEADFKRGIRTAEHAIEHPFRHGEPAPGADPYPQTPATQPVNLAPTGAATPQEDTMSLTTIEADVKEDLTEGMTYLEGLVQRVKAAAPGIIATSEAVGGSTVGQLAEIFLGKILPPDVEQEFLSIAKRYAASFGQPATAAAPADPAQPAAPAQ